MRESRVEVIRGKEKRVPCNTELVTFNGRERHYILSLRTPAFDVNNIKLLYYIKEVMFQFFFFVAYIIIVLMLQILIL